MAETLIKTENVTIDGQDMLKVEVPCPKEIKKYLDKHIISQDDAKRTIATAIYKHFVRLGQKDEGDGVEIEKTGILILGNSGCGKTEIARQVTKVLGLPFTIFDISNVSASGYVGNDLVFCLRDLLDAANGDVELAEKGVVFIDEFNKIARKSGANNSITQDVNGEKVQGELLRMVEDAIVDVPSQRGRLNPEQPMIKMNCKNILFIFSGAFEGLDKIIERRLGTTKGVGFNLKDSVDSKYDETNILKYVDTEDLLNYGIMRELVSRIPIITHVNKLTVEQLRQILTEPENAIIKQAKKLFKMHDKSLEFTDDALNYIAEVAESKNTGARALRGIVDRVVDNILYDIDEITDETITVTKEKIEDVLTIK